MIHMKYNDLVQKINEKKTITPIAKTIIKQYENIDPYLALSELELLTQLFLLRVEELEENVNRK